MAGIRNPSPLRYPGGKASLAPLLEALIYKNQLQGGIYAELFAGGAGAGLRLLYDGHVERILINDLDRAVYSFWKAVMVKTEKLLEKIQKTPLTVEEWERQRLIYSKAGKTNYLDLGFAAFYLNRCNRSGIIKNAGPIGGRSQSGKWKIDARFNREELCARIAEIASFGDRIIISGEDAVNLIPKLGEMFPNEPIFAYIDPPYFTKGRQLYLNYFNSEHHEKLACALNSNNSLRWVMTYDAVANIRSIYSGNQIFDFDLKYSAHPSSTEGGELLIAPKYLRLPINTSGYLKKLARRTQSK